MFNDSYLRACMKLRIVQKIRFSVLESGRTNACCPGLVSRPSAKAQEQVARSRGLIIQPPKLFGVSAECQSIGTIGKKQRAVARSRGLVIQPQNSQLVHILSFHSQTVVSLFIFPTGPTALNSKPRGRRYVKNTGDNGNRLYSRAIQCPASMEEHYIQCSFLRLCRILRFVKKIRFCLLESGRTKPWCPGLVSWPSAKAQEPLARSRGQWQEVEGLLFNPKNLSWCIF